MTKNIEEAIVKYMTGTATAKDLTMLSNWIKKQSNKEELEAFIKDYYAIEYSINDSHTDLAVNKLLSSIKKRKELTIPKKPNYSFKYAAAIIAVVILTGVYLFRENIFQQDLSQEITKEIKVGTDKAILTLANGAEIQLGAQEKYEEDEFSSNGSILEYFKNDDAKNSENIEYHYLTVPRGGKFTIVLSDGTQVWLNSDSKLKYPSKFRKGDSRKVELVYGEAYFDVSPANKNKGADFRVLNKEQEVKVLGTEFNLKAYKDEINTFTTLVEGKISLKYQDHKKILSPGQQASYNFEENSILTKTIDIYNETSWKDGIFSFDNKPLSDIMKVLSRWYDVEFSFSNQELKEEQFIGILSKNQDIENILEQIKNSGIINNYKIKNNEITIE